MLSWFGSALAWVAGIVVLVKLFQKEGILKGILGLICMIYTFIWGWIHFKDESLNLKNWMYIWTGCIVLGIILNIIGQAGR
jgi:drug/metabolite transporter (DMT)-like permease